MSSTNWTISGVDHHGNPYHYEGTHTNEDTEPYVWVWVLIISLTLVGAIVGGLICTGVLHCCKEMDKASGEYGAGRTLKEEERSEREFEKYIQDRI